MNGLNWKVSNLRISLFGIALPQFELEKLSLWRLMTGDDPTDRHQQPKTGISQDNGITNNGNLILKIESGRIDVVYTPANSFNITFEENLATSLAEFSVYAVRFLQSLKNFEINRVAFGSSLNHKTSSENESNRLLSQILGLNFGEDEFSDFTYRINYSKTTQVGSNKINLNRLSTWSSIVVITQLVSQSNPGVLLPAMQQNFVQLELDINNKPDSNFFFHSDTLINFYTQLRDVAISVSQDGPKGGT